MASPKITSYQARELRKGLRERGIYGFVDDDYYPSLNRLIKLGYMENTKVKVHFGNDGKFYYRNARITTRKGLKALNRYKNTMKLKWRCF